MHSSRRQFMIGCSSAVAALAGSRLLNVAWADTLPKVAADDRMLVVVFLRGGMDGLNFLAPVDDRDYIAARPPNLRLVEKGDNAALPIANGPAELDFRLHHNSRPIKELYDAKQLAFVHACGLTDGTRSHFEAMALMDRGASGGSRQHRTQGWLARYLASAPRVNGSGKILPAASGNHAVPNSLLGFADAMPIANANEFRFHGTREQLAALRKLYSGRHPLEMAGARTLQAFDIVQSKIKRDRNDEPVRYKPENNASYGDSDFARSMQSVAQLIKMDLGLRVATVDFGGWDTHQGQTYYFNELMGQLATALGAFYNDLSRYHGRLNVVVMSEFGRRLKANLSHGTDHGHGNVMMVMGGGVQGGKVYGKWPGLATEQLDCKADLAVTTDFRAVLAEVMTSRFGLAEAESLFPELPKAAPLGLFQRA